MLHESNPDNSFERQLAMGEIITVVKEKLSTFAEWQRFKLTKVGHDKAVASYPQGVTALPNGLINKLVQAISSLGWKVQSFEGNEVSLHCQGVKTRVLVEVKPEPDSPFTIRFI